MSAELEERLEAIGDALPTPTAAAEERARSAALAALGAPQARRRPFRGLGRPGALLLAAGILSAVIAVALLVSPWQSNAHATQRALAALGDEPVIHAVVENGRPWATVVDLASGAERPLFQRNEYWYDDDRSLLRLRLSVGGQPLPGGEFVQTPQGMYTDLGFNPGSAGAPGLDPGLAGFASRYRDALASGQAHVVGNDVVDGRDAIVLRFDLEAAGRELSEDVAVDADDYRPIRFRYSVGGSSEAPWWSVLAIETIPREPGRFEPPGPSASRPGGQTGVEERELTPSDAATALDRPAVWPGQAVNGVALSRIQLRRLTTKWTRGPETEDHGLELLYGADRRTSHLTGKPSLTITEGTSPETALRGDFEWASIPPGHLWLTGAGDNDGSAVDMWFGSMVIDGMYVTFESAQRELIVAAAGAMAPIR